MSHSFGTNLGGVRDLESLRARCVCIAGDDCWHLRTATGKRPRAGATLVIWSGLHGRPMSARKLAVLLSGRRLRSGDCTVDTCGERDCVNPAHLLRVTRERAPTHASEQGRHATARKAIANRVAGLKRSRVSLALRAELAASSRTAKELALEHGLSRSWVNALRARARSP